MLKIFSSNELIHELNFNDDKLSGNVDGESFSWDIVDLGDGHKHLIYQNKSYNLELIDINKSEKTVKVAVNGHPFEFSVKDRFDELLSRLGMDMAANSGELQIKAPMPGLVLDILVKEGEEVAQGAPLLILEAMKMENVIKAGSDAVVDKIHVSTGKAVEKNQVLIEFGS